MKTNFFLHQDVAARSEVGGMTVVPISPQDLRDVESGQTGAIFVDGEDRVLDLVTTIREHVRHDVLLAPVVLLGGEATDASAWVDATWDPSSGGRLPSRVSSVITTIAQRRDLYLSAGSIDNSLTLRLLRFLASRDLEIEPRPAMAPPFGYRYPNLRPFGVAHDIELVWDTLGVLEAKGYLRGRFITKLHNCPHCRSGFLNFYETCTDCGSADIESEETVHHFQCGYVAPLSAYRHRGGLKCPKCDRELRQVGVDYDKPGLMHSCQACGAAFGDPDVRTTCLGCGRSASPDDLSRMDVKAYRVTAMGQNAALYGLSERQVVELAEGRRLVPLSEFMHFLAVEKERIRRYAVSSSTVATIFLPDTQRVFNRLGSRGHEVLEQVARSIVSGLRTTDIVTSQNGSLFGLLLTETPVEDVRPVMARLTTVVHDLMSQAMDQDMELRHSIAPVSPDLDYDRLVQDLVTGMEASRGKEESHAA